MKKKKGIKSLYVYLSISFVVILAIVLLATIIYFVYIRKNLDIPQDEVIVKNLINELNMEKIQTGLKNAMIYGTSIGIALILVVASHIIKPIRKITDATKKVASGDFNVDVDIKRNDEIGDLVDNFNVMVKELNSIEYLRKDFVSNVSHELKTPIAAIQGFAKLLAQDNLSEEEKQEYIDIILEETARLSNLSSNMIKLSKFENQEIITNKKKYRLDEQLRKAIIMLEEKINKKDIKINLKSEEITIVEDEDLIMEIWINLLNNAVKYTNEKGRIDVKVNEENEFVKVEIKDNGIGIPKNKQDRIFEKFYQAEKSHSSDGSGLGLAIVKRIIDLTGGNIKIESEEGKGTTFVVYIKKESNSKQ